MMRPMKLAGSELMFGEGCLEYIKTIKVEKVSIVDGMQQSLAFSRSFGNSFGGSTDSIVFNSGCS